MNLWVPEYEPDEHETQITALYDRPVPDDPPTPHVERSIVICFTNRCGSNYLSEALRSTGSVQGAQEHLNYATVGNRTRRMNLPSFGHYLVQLGDEFGHRGILTLKAGLKQLYFVASLGLLGCALPAPSFVLIERNDVVAQAVSWVIATQTGHWTRVLEPHEAELAYSYDAIDGRIEAILNENASFRAFLSKNGLDSVFVQYEDLWRFPNRTVSRLADELRLSDGEYRRERVEIERQTSSTNREWKERYIREVASR